MLNVRFIPDPGSRPNVSASGETYLNDVVDFTNQRDYYFNSQFHRLDVNGVLGFSETTLFINHGDIWNIGVNAYVAMNITFVNHVENHGVIVAANTESPAGPYTPGSQTSPARGLEVGGNTFTV